MYPVITEETYVISDLHFGHNRVLEFEPCRKDAMGEEFETQEDMLVANWNSVISNDDTIIVLGDFAFKQIAESTARLNGHKILIRGNHDKRTTQVYLDAGFEYVYDTIVYQDDKYTWSLDLNDSYISALIINIAKDKIMLCHYPIDIYQECYVNREYYDLTNRVKALTNVAEHLGVNKHIHGHTHSLCMPNSDSLNYYNVSCENLGFKPVKIKDLL